MQSTTSSPSAMRNTTLLVVVLAALWMGFSGKTDVVHLSYGALSIALVVLLTRSLVIARRDPRENEYVGRLSLTRAVVYVVWLVLQIVVANVQVSWIIVQPRIPVRPALIRFRSGYRSALAKTTLGNSITLTPGTFTLRIRDDEFLIHTFHEKLASALLDETLQRKVAALFGEQVPDDLEVTVVRDPDAVRGEVERWSS